MPRLKRTGRLWEPCSRARARVRGRDARPGRPRSLAQAARHFGGYALFRQGQQLAGQVKLPGQPQGTDGQEHLRNCSGPTLARPTPSRAGTLGGLAGFLAPPGPGDPPFAGAGASCERAGGNCRTRRPTPSPARGRRPGWASGAACQALTFSAVQQRGDRGMASSQASLASTGCTGPAS